MFKASIGWLHQALRIDLPVVLVFTGLELGAQLRVLHLLAIVGYLVQAHSSVISELDRAALSVSVIMTTYFCDPDARVSSC